MMWLGCERRDDGSWYDTENSIVFGKEETVVKPNRYLHINGSVTKDTSFFEVPETWNDGVHGTPRVNRQMHRMEEGWNPCWSTNGVAYGFPIDNNTEYYVTRHPKFGSEMLLGTPTNIPVPFIESHTNQSILVVGAGPTANEVDWHSAVEKYSIDHVWSMNHFFLNNKVAEHPKLDLVTLGNEVKFDDPNVVSYFESHPNILIYQEPCFVKKNYETFIDKFSDRIGWFHLRYCSKLGTAPRMILLAILSGAKDIYVVGFDGYTRDMKAKHAFENVPDQKEGYPYDTWRRGMVVFWDYVLHDLQPRYNFNIYNLGHGHPSNMSTGIPSLVKE